jgi:hypothetical protein
MDGSETKPEAEDLLRRIGGMAEAQRLMVDNVERLTRQAVAHRYAIEWLLRKSAEGEVVTPEHLLDTFGIDVSEERAKIERMRERWVTWGKADG